MDNYARVIIPFINWNWTISLWTKYGDLHISLSLLRQT